MIPSESELANFIKKSDLLNYTAIAKHFNIKNSTVSDLIDALIKKRVVEVKKVGGSKIVQLRKEGK